MFINAGSAVRLFLLTLIAIILLCSPASAVITDLVTEDESGALFQYSYAELLDSYALKITGNSNGLYEHFFSRTPFALKDSIGGYVDYRDVADRYARALVEGEGFSVNRYAESGQAKRAAMPGSINLVRISDGKLVNTTFDLTEEGSGDSGRGSDKATILGLAEVTLDEAREWAIGRDAEKLYIDIAEVYWQFAPKVGIRPEVLYAQAAIETNFGRYTGNVPPEHNNWAGIRTADAQGHSAQDHEAFENPEDGVRAHFNHMAAYVGLEPVGEPHGRYTVAASQSWAGTVQYVEELSGKWAPDPEYHYFVLALLDQMQGAPAEEPAVDPEPNHPGPNPEPKPAPQPEPEDIPARQVVVEASALRLRSGPGTEFEVLELLPKGTVVTADGRHNAWLRVSTLAGSRGWVHGDYVKDVTAPPPGGSLKGKKVVVDAGHGGSDPGAIGVTGLQEKVVNLAVARHLGSLLSGAGATVVYTRSGDQYVSNLQRLQISDNAKADLYLSIHANAFSKAEANGIETFYHPNNSHSVPAADLASHLQRELVAALGLRNRGVKTANFYVISNVSMPAALVELGFLTNPKEEALLRDPQNQQKAAQALFRGIEAHFRR